MKKILTLNIPCILVVAVFVMISGCKKESDDSIDNYFNRLPHDLKIDNSTPQKYLLTEDYFNKNGDGTFSDKARITGEYIRGLEGGYVKWNNTYFTRAYDSIEQAFPTGTQQEYMENLTYIPSASLLFSKDSLFENFPPSFPDRIYAINLTWDMYGLENLAWLYFDSLSLNIPYRVTNADIKIQILITDFLGTYEHKDIQICWTGVTKMNNENCAIIDFTALNNSIEFSLPQFKSKGNEDYWGTVYVSLKDKQIEYGVMYNSTTQDIQLLGLNQKLTSILTREVKVERIK